MSIARIQSTILLLCHGSQSLIMCPSCLPTSWIVNVLFPKGPRNPRQRGAGQKDAERREQRHRTNGGEKRGTTNQTHKKTKRSDREEKEAGAHKADGGANARTDTPQREEPAHAPSNKRKRAPNRAARKGKTKRREEGTK